MSTPRLIRLSPQSPSPDPALRQYGLIADAIYEYCRSQLNTEDIILQHHLLEPDIIPGKSPDILLAVCQHLVDNHLFKIHELRDGSIGWKVVSRESAQNYEGLNQDETLVYAVIETAGTQGIWTRFIKAKVNLHAKVIERAFKSLESKGRIEPFKDVQNPMRKMFIVKGLRPNESATGGEWYTDGELDKDMVDLVAIVIEKLVSSRSWVLDEEEADPGVDIVGSGVKRKAPVGGFDAKGKGKLMKTTHPTSDSEQLRPRANPHRPKYYVPQPPGYVGYMTLSEITKEINKSQILNKGTLPENEVEKLLNVMVYDDRLIKLQLANHPERIMYKAIRNPDEISAALRLERKIQNGDDAQRKLAIREKELEQLGRGGANEVPCMRCPVFSFCEEGGPVNASTCIYFDDWFKKLEELHLKDGEIM